MTQLARFRVGWSGAPGLPGLSTFYAVSTAVGWDPNAFNSALSTMFTVFKGQLPFAVTITFPSAVDFLEDTTGVLTSSGSVTAPPPISGSGSSVYSAPSGVVVKWQTASVLDGHRVQGKTYIVPTINTLEAANGVPNAGVLGAMQAGANAFATSQAGFFCIWHRPRKASATIPARAGGHALVTGAVMLDKFAVLTSRRD